MWQGKQRSAGSLACRSDDQATLFGSAIAITKGGKDDPGTISYREPLRRRPRLGVRAAHTRNVSVALFSERMMALSLAHRDGCFDRELTPVTSLAVRDVTALRQIREVD